MRCHHLLFTLIGALATACAQDPAPVRPADHNGLSTDPKFFPLAVWVQDPANAPRYRELGINTYVGLWQGPTREQLVELDRHGLKVVCAQNEVALAHPGDTILAWLHGDEPDNAQEVAGGGYGPPILPAKVIAEYERLRKADRRPIMLNLSQGAAWDGWWGRGVRTNHPEDYAEYLRGCDIASFDIYPVTHKKPEVHGKLEFVGHGVRRLTQWSGGKPVFACIETTHIDNADSRPTPEQVRAEVWIALTCGARGITYFAHEFAPKFVEAGLLARPEIAAAVRDVNLRIAELAPILNAPSIQGQVEVTAGGADVAILCKPDGKDLVVFAALLQAEPATVRFRGRGAKASAPIDVLGEARQLPHEHGAFTDAFAGYGIHHYRIPR